MIRQHGGSVATALDWGVISLRFWWPSFRVASSRYGQYKINGDTAELSDG